MKITLGNGNFVAEIKNNKVYIAQKYFKRAKKAIAWLLEDTNIKYYVVI